MIRAVFYLIVLLGASAAGLAADVPGTELPVDGSPTPHFDLTRQHVEYAGPGRDDPAPVDVEDVRVGYFGPSDPDHPVGGDLWLAASLAVEEANLAGGWEGLPFRLVPAWSEDPWGSGVGRLARMTYDDQVWAIIGSIDGASTHLAEQVVAKARLTLISPASTDKTVNLTNVAWMFSCLPADSRQAKLIGRTLMDRAQPSFILISGTDHDSRRAARELTGFLSLVGVVPDQHFEVDPGTSDLARLTAETARTDASAIVILADPLESARLVVALRDRRPDLPILGGPSMARRVFLENAGPAAEGARFPLLCDRSVRPGGFGSRFLARFDREPDCAAAQTYDATRLLIEAIRDAGLNRARIRDAVRASSPWSGSAGVIEWDPSGQNRREVRLATVSDGRVIDAGPHDR